jgi:hypothetical protein
MKAKEKSQELFDKYWELNTDFDGLIKYELAKQCALIAIDEILCFLSYQSHIKFWQEVKQEIEKL